MNEHIIPCMKCNTDKPCGDFGKDKSKDTGRNRICKQCRNAEFRKYYWANLEMCRYAARISTRQRRGLPSPTRPVPELCECCGKSPKEKSLHLDHCHETGAFRGWLCNKCNRGLGMLGDNMKGIQRVITYLNRCEDEY